MFEFLRKKSRPEGVVNKEIAQSLISFVFNDSNLWRPVYMENVLSEHDAESVGLGPLVIVWNEDLAKGTISVSINKEAVEHLLEGAMDSSHKDFVLTRNEIINVLRISSSAAVVDAIKNMGVPASVLFGLNKK